MNPFPDRPRRPGRVPKLEQPYKVSIIFSLRDRVFFQLYAARYGEELTKSEIVRRAMELLCAEFTEEEIAAMLEAIERENAAS